MLLVLRALAAFWLVELARSPDRVRVWMLDGKKPWVCDLCMSLWTALVLTIAFPATSVVMKLWPVPALVEFGVEWLATAGGTLALVRLVRETVPRLPPPG